MAHSIQTSRLSPPPADLRPAPLRIPLRKTVAGFEDGPGTAVAKGKVSGRDTSTSTSFQRDSGRHTQSDIPHTLPEKRDPRSKLESLVSRFEILDAVNSADTSVPQYLNNPYRARPSTILRATGSKRSLSQDPFSHSPTESISRASSELSPRQIRTPGAFSRQPMLSMNTQHITNIPDALDRDHSDVNRDSTCPRVGDDKDMDIDERQTSGPSSSYFTSHSTASSSSQRPG